MKPPYNLYIAPKARAGLRTMRRSSRQIWGEEQSFRYATQVENALNVLTEFPSIGRPCGHLRPGLRGHVVGQHIIYYFVDDGSIRVARILHTRMDAPAQFVS